MSYVCRDIAYAVLRLLSASTEGENLLRRCSCALYVVPRLFFTSSITYIYIYIYREREMCVIIHRERETIHISICIFK